MSSYFNGLSQQTPFLPPTKIAKTTLINTLEISHKRLHLDKITRLASGMISTWNDFLFTLQLLPNISIERPDKLLPIPDPMLVDEVAKEQLVIQRSALQTSCKLLASKILTGLSTDSAYPGLAEDFQKLKKSQKQWFTCRFCLDRESINEPNIYSFSLLEEALRKRQYLAKFHDRVKKHLSGSSQYVEFTNDITLYHTSKNGEMASYLVLPGANADKELIYNSALFHETFREIVSLDPSKIMLKATPGMTMTGPFDHNGRSVQIATIRIYSLDQLKEMINNNKLGEINEHYNDIKSIVEKEGYNIFLGTFAYGYRAILSDLLFGDRNYLSQTQINDLFLNSLKHPYLAAEIAHYISYDNPDFVQTAMRFAIDYDNEKTVKDILEKYPSLKIVFPKATDLLWALKKGLSDLAITLIESGVDANSNKAGFDVRKYYTRQSTLGNIVKWAENQICHDYIMKSTMKAVNYLVDHGADVNQQMSSDCYSEYDCSIVERCYLNRYKDNALCREIMGLLLEKGAKISSRLAQAMILEIKATGNTAYVKYLTAQNYISQNDLPYLLGQTKVQNNSSDLSQKCLDAVVFLERSARLNHLNHSGLVLETLSQIRQLKKTVKRHLHDSGEASPQLEQSYNYLCKAYDNVVSNHLLLSELRATSQEIRDPSKITWRTVRFFGLWSPDNTYILNNAKSRLQNIDVKTRKVYWETMRDKIIPLAQRVDKDRYLSRHFITWMHGTRSCSLPVILKMAQLEPLGSLLKKNYVTFSGECCGSDKELNALHISGERLTASWGEGLVQYYDAVTRSHTAYLYANNTRGYRPNETVFKPELAWERASINHINQLVSEHEHHHTFWTVVRLDILRLRSTDQKADEKLLHLKQHIEGLLKNPPSEANKKELDDLLRALTEPVAVKFDEQDMKMINDPAPYGIILATTTHYSQPYCNTSNNEPYEFIVDQSIQLGKEMQIAFTAKEKVEELSRLMKPFGIRVYDFDTLFYLEMMSMIRGTRHRKFEFDDLKGRPPTEVVQNKICLALQQDILPCYAKPFPALPKYRDEGGQTTFIANPDYGHKIRSYAEYLERVGAGKMQARNIHGPMHAIRVSIWSQLIKRLYQRKGITDNTPPYLLALTAAAHDLNRQDEAKDYWDRSSAKWLKAYLITRGYQQSEIEPLYHAIADKDPHGRNFTSFVQKWVHDADCLEIMRCLMPGNKFRKEELCFYKDLENEDGILDKLIAEVEDFISRTEDPTLKLSLEEYSDNYYADVMKILISVHAKEGRYPLMTSLLNEELNVFKVTA